ncbi:MAG: DUF4365 domain-containing protein [bacterium]|nr:DUF4365 domain-containing protein [bacterium]
MSKKFTATAQVERQGVALCASVVAEMGHIWREKSVSDVGVDGEIELVDLTSREALGRLLLVQSKARSGEFEGETEDSIRFRCTEDDLNYWLSASAPVLLVCSRPSTKEAWFKNIPEWFSANPERRAKRIVEFSKVDDRFDASAGRRLIDWGVPASSGIYLRPPPRPETLVTNLLRVEHIAQHVHLAPSSVRGWKDINARMRTGGHPLVNDVVWRDKHVYSFRGFDEPPLDVLADDTPERISTDELADSGAEEDRRFLVRLLNGTLREIHSELHWHRGREYLYFPASSDLQPRAVRAAGKRGRGRTVFERYLDKETKSRVVYYRHYALRFQFLYLDQGWYLALTPTYHFTHDGSRESRYAGDYLKRIKQIEGHGAVGNLTKFWAGYLRSRSDLFASPDQRLRLGLLAELDLAHGIDDEHWKRRDKTAVAGADQQQLEGIT